jgi:hypothetical protein
MELPRRLLRLPHNSTEPIHPLIRYLFDTYTPSPDAPDGYPLARAVLSSNYALMGYLLEKGADPAVKDGLAVEVAISKKDLKAVRLLVEARSSHGKTRALTEDGSDDDDEERKRGPAGRNKRRKIGEKVMISQRLVEVAMRKGSREIVHYFVHEKGEFGNPIEPSVLICLGVMPPLNSIMKLGNGNEAAVLPPVKPRKRR